MSYKVYLYTFPNGKRYVGMTKNSLEERRDMGYQHNKPLQAAIRKYGWNGFKHTILYDNLSEKEACEKEKEYIVLYDTTNPEKGYNVSFGGKSTFAGLHHTKEHKEKISKLYKGKVFTEEHLKHLKESHKEQCKSVVCFDLSKRAVNTYSSLNEAARTVKGHASNIKRACISGRIYKNYFWQLANESEVI